jgi:hypothetical protein
LYWFCSASRWISSPCRWSFCISGSACLLLQASMDSFTLASIALRWSAGMLVDALLHLAI